LIELKRKLSLSADQASKSEKKTGKRFFFFCSKIYNTVVIENRKSNDKIARKKLVFIIVMGESEDYIVF
jgi:hypothetical protein